MTNITVLKDENLGGIEREYREVKRKAAVGELVKMYDYAHGQNGDILKVRASMGGAEQFEGKRDGHGSPHYIDGRGNDGYVYLTLESTDIIRINTPDGDGEAARYRMVDRKAAVGERVIVTEIVDYAMSEMTVGRSYEVVSIQTNFDEPPYVNVIDDAGDTASADQRGYRVLEPVESAQISESLSAKPAPDQAAEIIAKLTTRVGALEAEVRKLAIQTRVVREDCVLIEEGVSEDVRDLIKRVELLESVSPALRKSTVESAPKSPQEIRDDIVKRAKEDLNELSNGYGNYIFRGPRTRIGRICGVEFVVTRDKRKVTAILRGVNSRKVYAVGRAVCSPDDVFSVHLGRAISLRKALNQPIPPEYFEAPNPTEVRVGDVVMEMSSGGTFTVVPDARWDGSVMSVDHANRWLGRMLALVDDSRESDSAEPRKEVA